MRHRFHETMEKLWDGLKECSVSREVVKSTLFKKLDSFPRILSKVSLRELNGVQLATYLARPACRLPMASTQEWRNYLRVYK